MAARHYRLEYSTDGGANWFAAVADEAPGPGKTVPIGGLATGTYSVLLRMVPLTGNPVPIVSNPTILQVGSPSLVEPLQSTASSVVSLSDVLTCRDNLLAAIGVQATAADQAQLADQLAAQVTVQATSTDVRLMFEQLVASAQGQVSIAELQVMVEKAVAAIAGVATVTDVQTGIIVENVIAAASSGASAGDLVQMVEHLVAAATGVATQADGLVMRENVSAAATTTATIADVRHMLEGVLAAASAVATVADTYTPGAAGPADIFTFSIVNDQIVVTGANNVPIPLSTSYAPDYGLLQADWLAPAIITSVKCYGASGGGYDEDTEALGGTGAYAAIALTSAPGVHLYRAMGGSSDSNGDATINNGLSLSAASYRIYLGYHGLAGDPSQGWNQGASNLLSGNQVIGGGASGENSSVIIAT
jgi:hypothetical protein